MWFSLSNRVFLGSCSCLRGSGQCSLSRMWAHLFCGHTGCCSFRDVLWPRPLACFPSDLVEGRTRDSVLVMCPLGSSFLVNTSRAEVSASRLSTGYAAVPQELACFGPPNLRLFCWAACHPGPVFSGTWASLRGSFCPLALRMLPISIFQLECDRPLKQGLSLGLGMLRLLSSSS